MTPASERDQAEQHGSGPDLAKARRRAVSEAALAAESLPAQPIRGGTYERDGTKSKIVGGIQVPTSDGMARDMAREQARAFLVQNDTLSVVAGLLDRWAKALEHAGVNGMTGEQVLIMRTEMQRVRAALPA